MEGQDAAAVAAVLGGDRDAFRPLVERYSRPVFRLAFRMLNSEEDAEEAVQETFLRAYRSLERFERRSQFSTWLYRICSNCCMDMLERRKRQPQPFAIPAEEENEGAPEDRLPSADPSPERRLLDREVAGRALHHRQRVHGLAHTAFVMRHFEGRSIEEISAVLDIRGVDAKNTVFRAVRKMRAALAPLVRRA